MALSILSPLPASATDDRPPAVFVVAHQDDELLTMGSAIRQHVEEGRHVVVVVATDGANTIARYRLEKKLGYLPSTVEITQHRDREYRLAAYRLGADERRVAPAGLRIVDGQSTPESADAIFDWVMTRWPGASVKSHSYLSPTNVDHKNLGEALLRAYEDGSIPDARFYLSQDERKRMDVLPKTSRVSRDVGDIEQKSYRHFDGDKWWAVGYTSVKAMFDYHRNDPSSWMHRPHAVCY